MPLRTGYINLCLSRELLGLLASMVLPVNRAASVFNPVVGPEPSVVICWHRKQHSLVCIALAVHHHNRASCGTVKTRLIGLAFRTHFEKVIEH